MVKFQVGDIIRCKPGNPGLYYLTNEAGLYEVADECGRGIVKIKIISHSTFPQEVGKMALVKADHFELARERKVVEIIW